MHSSTAAPPVPYPAEPRAEAADFAQIGRALRSRGRMIVGATLLGFAAALVFVQTVTPRYTGEAKILLESRDSFFTRPTQDRSDLPPQIDEQAVASQVQVVMSRDLAREAVKRLGLVGNPEFDPLVGGLGLGRRLMMMLGLSNNLLDRPPEDRVLEEYYEHLLVYPAGKSRVVSIEFRSKDPELASRAANTIAELYLTFQEAAKQDTARSASTWLGSNVEALRTRVTEAEAKVEEFRARTGLFAGGGNNAPINAQQLADLNTQLSQARSAQADSQAKAKLIREMIKAGKAFDIPDVANNELIRRLIEQRITLRAQLALELRTLLPQHPRIKELNAQVDDLESQVRGAAERTVRTLENDARIAGSRVEAVQAALDEQKKVVVQANENEVQLRALEREAKAQRDQLESYLSRYREATARDAEKAAPADARIVSRAIVPDVPSFPKKLPIIAFGTVAAFLLAAGTVVARELLGAPQARPEDREPFHADEPAFDEPAFEEPATAEIPFEPAPVPPRPAPVPAAEDADTAEPRALPVAAEVPEPVLGAASEVEERYLLDALVERLSRGEVSGQGRRILVTAVGDAADAQALALSLGRQLALAERAILITLDENASPAGRIGLTDLVAAEATFSDVIGREAGSKLHVVAPGRIDASVLADESQRLEFTLAAFDQTYDWTLCLLPRGRQSTLLALFAGMVDAVVIASEDDADSAPLIALYDEAKAAGAAEVVVARESEISEAPLLLAS